MGAMTKQGMQFGSIAAGILLVAWIALFFSGRGVLYWYTQPSGDVGMLKCSYFTGTQAIERQFLYTKQGMLGRDTCPRFIELDK